MTGHRYDNQVHPDNVYGHTLELLRRHAADPPADGIHVDLACGFGNIAEHVRDDLGLTYVGTDIDDEELAAVRGRGFEAHTVDLMADDLTARLDSVVAGRRVVSVSFLDGLEHLTDGSTALAAVRHLVRGEGAVAVLSVPNVTHLDVATKAVLGSWDYTESGLLDRTHYQLWSARGLTESLATAGLDVVDEYDVEMAASDQAFPAGHLGLSRTTSLGAWLHAVRERVEPHAFTNQFVWALQPTVTELPHDAATSDDETPGTPFLSVVLLTQGQRPQELREALLCLAAQTVSDFEVLLVAHDVGSEEHQQLTSLIEEQPSPLRQRTRLVASTGGGPATGLNVGVRGAQGAYIALLSEGDTVFANWVERFREGAGAFQGRIIRGVPLDQVAARATVGPHTGVKSLAAPLPAYGVDFSLAEHLTAEVCRPLSFAFPRSLHADLGLVFDGTPDDADVLAFLLHGAELAGVADLAEPVAISRSAADHAAPSTGPSEGRTPAVERIHERPYLLTAGGTMRLVEDRQLAQELQERLDEQLALKDNHIANIEAMLETERTRVADLTARLQSQRQRARQLKRRVRKLQRRAAGGGGRQTAPRRSVVRRLGSRLRPHRRS